jgi:hypothetical protein
MVGLGRVQRQVRRCLIAHNGPVPFSELLAWAYLNRRPHRCRVYFALQRFGRNVGFGMWAPNAELADQIFPNKH